MIKKREVLKDREEEGKTIWINKGTLSHLWVGRQSEWSEVNYLKQDFSQKCTKI